MRYYYFTYKFTSKETGYESTADKMLENTLLSSLGRKKTGDGYGSCACGVSDQFYPLCRKTPPFRAGI